ncbi:hypothetical protein N7535_003292 [Penicillium sp. DV-2018c]|nr:hypothetical protein N7535_003292 [Penicillium sp. DV-2018c]
MRRRASTTERSTQTPTTPNPNGFITERELAGERRSIRRYNDGRISGRSSVEPSPRRRASTSASTRNSSRSSSRTDNTGDTTRASSRMGPFISRRSSLSLSLSCADRDRPPSSSSSPSPFHSNKLSDLAAEISAEVARFSADKPNSASAQRLRATWNNVRNGKAKAMPKKVNEIHSSGAGAAGVAGSTCSTRTEEGSIIARIVADIEDRIRRQNVGLKPVLEGDE